MNITEISTYFTARIGTSELLYSAEDWVEITLRLETAGPVAVSTRQEIIARAERQRRVASGR